MRQYDIVSGILFLLFIIDFALAAPVLVQEKRQACVNVAHIPKSMITVSGKRGFEELDKLAEEFSKTWGKSIGSSDTHASSSSALPGPGHGPTDVVQAPNPASSTANPDPLVGPSSPSSTVSMQGSWDRYKPPSSYDGSNEGDDELLGSLHSQSSSEHGSPVHDLTWAHAPQSNPNPASSSTANPSLLMQPSIPTIEPMSDSFEDRFREAWDKEFPKKGSGASLKPTFTPPPSESGSDNELEWATSPVPKVRPIQIPGPSPGADPNFDWEHWANAPSPPKLSSPKDLGLVPEHQMGHVQQLNAGPFPGADPDFDWEHWANAPSPPKPSSPKDLGLVPEHQMGHVQQPNTGSSPGADSDFDWEGWANAPSPPKPSSPKDLGLVPEHQMGHVQQPNAGSSPGADPNFDWEGWANAASPPKPSSPKEFGLAPEYQVGNAWVRPSKGPDPYFDMNKWMNLDDPLAPALRPVSTKVTGEGRIPWSDDASNPSLTTKPDSDPNLAAHQPPPFQLSSTELDKDHDVNTPLPYAPAATDFNSYSYPGSVPHPPSPVAAGSLTVPEHEVVVQPPSRTGLPTVPEHEVVIQPPSRAGSPTVPEQEGTPPSPNLEPLEEPEHEVVHRPPTTPESTDPELNSDPQPLSASSQPVDLQAAIYAAKGKAKELRSISGSAGDVGNAVQRKLQPAESRLIRGTRR